MHQKNLDYFYFRKFGVISYLNFCIISLLCPIADSHSVNNVGCRFTYLDKFIISKRQNILAPATPFVWFRAFIRMIMYKHLFT